MAYVHRSLQLPNESFYAFYLMKTLVYRFLAILNAQGVAAMIDFDTVITQSRQLSMSGILGILDTDILFAEPGSEQPEYWRLVQGTLGIGALRVLSRICKTPCFEMLHLMHGIKLPEAVEAREFWLRQEAWSEIRALDMGQEDTSYHRINQGSGPQGKLLWNWEEIEAERELWGSESEGDLGLAREIWDWLLYLERLVKALQVSSLKRGSQNWHGSVSIQR
jgi:hypothetical protein